MQNELSQSSYIAFSSFLHEKIGIVLGNNRQYLVRSRLSTIARDNHYANMNLFLEDLINNKNQSLTDKCLELMTTNETFWFRDIYPFTLLTTHLLPKFEKQQQKLRIWSSACASGQESYSIAMTIDDYKQKNPNAFPRGVEIVATDFSGQMISTAQAGIYDELALARGLDNKHRREYFEKTPVGFPSNAMQINANIKRTVQFKRFNLLNSFESMGKFDIIFCRNVLIYFDGNQKVETLKKFAACLPPSGALVLGAAESIQGANDRFHMQTIGKGLYYSKL